MNDDISTDKYFCIICMISPIQRLICQHVGICLSIDYAVADGAGKNTSSAKGILP